MRHVTCINNGGSRFLTIGKQYPVVREHAKHGDMFFVLDDEGLELSVYTNWFKEDSSDVDILFNNQSLSEGLKYDQEKPDLSLLPKEFLEEVAKAFMYGEKKYGRYNYLGGMEWHRIVAAAMRHIMNFQDGKDTDSESGIHHLGHAGACIAMLLTYYHRNLGKDTRYKKP